MPGEDTDDTGGLEGLEHRGDADRAVAVGLIDAIPSGEYRLLPNGGHLGYAGTNWVHALLVKFFKAGEAK